MDDISIKLKIEENKKEIDRLKRLSNANLSVLNKMLGIFIAITAGLIVLSVVLIGVGVYYEKTGVIVFGVLFAIIGVIFAGVGIGGTLVKKIKIAAEKEAAKDKIRQLEKENTIYQEELNKKNS